MTDHNDENPQVTELFDQVMRARCTATDKARLDAMRRKLNADAAAAFPGAGVTFDESDTLRYLVRRGLDAEGITD